VVKLFKSAFQGFVVVGGAATFGLVGLIVGVCLAIAVE
jgi:hypothetical protein